MLSIPFVGDQSSWVLLSATVLASSILQQEDKFSDFLLLSSQALINTLTSESGDITPKLVSWAVEFNAYVTMSFDEGNLAAILDQVGRCSDL